MYMRIKELRKSLGMTQQDFADALHVSRNNIAGYETNTRKPSEAVVSLICKEFDVNEEWLRDGEGKMFVKNTGINMDERLKKLRKVLDLTQHEFAARIGVKQNTIATYEMGKGRVPSSQTLKSICREFNVNEEWLRDGTGKMFTESDCIEQLLNQIRGMLVNESSDFKYRFVNMLPNLSASDWKLLQKIVIGLAGTEGELPTT